MTRPPPSDRPRYSRSQLVKSYFLSVAGFTEPEAVTQPASAPQRDTSPLGLLASFFQRSTRAILLPDLPAVAPHACDRMCLGCLCVQHSVARCDLARSMHRSGVLRLPRAVHSDGCGELIVD